MAKHIMLRTLLQLCALVGGAAALSGQEPTVADACAWCTGPYKCEEIDDDGWAGCKIESGKLCEHYGNECIKV